MKTNHLIFTSFLFLALFATAFSQVPNYVPTNGLLGWWPFTGNANDLSGNGNNGTVNGATLTTDRFGGASSAYSFDGVNDYISTQSSGPLGNSNRSISVWLNSNSSNLSQIMGYGYQPPSGGEFNLLLNQLCPGITIDIHNNYITFSSINLTDGNWHNIICIYNNSINSNILGVRIYVDGVLLINSNCQNPINVNVNTLNTPLNFGRYQVGYNHFNGKLDDIGIWNRALTNCEIQALYQGSPLTSTITPQSSTTFCQGGSVNLTSSQGSTYLWSNGQTTQSISATTSGSYTVQVTDVNGCVETSAPTVVTVNPNPQVTITGSGPTTFCSGDSVTITSTGGSSYQWSNNQSGDSISVNTSGMFYTIGTDNNGCIDTSNTISVVVNPNPQVSISNNGSTTFCQGGSVTLTSTGASSYQWSNNQSGDSISVNTSGSLYTIGTDANGCIDTSNIISVVVNPNPQVSISNNSSTTFCQGSSVTLTSTGASTYQWSNNQSGDSISVNTSGSFFTIGSDANGCVDTSNTISVIVNPNPQVTISSSGPTTFCSGGTVTLIGSGVPFSYLWSNGQPVQFINVNTTGTYYVIGTDNNGCIDTSNAITVQVNPLPTVVSSNTGPYCEGDNLMLNSSGGVSYSWTGPNGFSSTNQSPQLNNLSVSMGGQYQVSSIDINGCIGNSSTLVVVNPNPTVTTGNPQSVCQGQTISLTSTGGSTYQWSGVNGFASTNQNPTIPNSDLTMSGQYVVVGFNSFGCSDTGFINVVVNPLPVITSSGGGVFCSGSNVSLSSTGGQTYTWSGPNGFMSTQQNPVLTNVTQSMSGNYIVTGTDMNGCSSSSTLTMNVVSGPVVTTQPQNQTVGVPGPATFSIVSSNPNALFQWQTDLGVGFQNLTNSGQYSGVNTNTVTVNNVGFNNNNQQFRCIISTTSCSDTSDVGILFVDDSMTLEGQSEETIKIYPNPTQTDFTIEVPDSVVGERFVVLDNLGRVVLKDDIRSTNQQISIQHLSRGPYVIKVGNQFNQILILN